MEHRHKAIGLLDSGVGGLTLVRELNRQLPGENIVYFGDTARMPYGPRPLEEVREFVVEIIEFMAATQDLKLVIIACNTATIAALKHCQQRFPFPVLGVIEPGARAAVDKSKNGRIGVLATESTIASKAYPNAIREFSSEVSVYDQASPRLVLLVENQLVNSPEAYSAAQNYLKPLLEQGIDSLILGCTHFPIMEHVLAQVAGPDVAMINPALNAVKAAGEILAGQDLLNDGRKGWQRFFVSGEPKFFEEIGENLLGYALRAYRVIF